jgi:hypothetical protein
MTKRGKQKMYRCGFSEDKVIHYFPMQKAMGRVHK